MYKENQLQLLISGSILVLLLITANISAPYFYYQIVNLFTTISLIFLSYKSNLTNDKIFTYIFGFLALLFQPLFPIYFGKEGWVILDYLTSLILFTYIISYKVKIIADFFKTITAILMFIVLIIPSGIPAGLIDFFRKLI